MLIVAATILALAFATDIRARVAANGERCPAPQPRAEARIQNLLSLPGIRTEGGFDLGSASASDVRLLRNQTDRETCRALWAALADAGTVLSEGDRVSFFRSGDRYFVPITPRPSPPGVIRIGERGGIQVYDAEFRLVARFGA